MKQAKYTVDYFIRKFKAIPKNRWCVNRYKIGVRRCAIGHTCKFATDGDPIFTRESDELNRIFRGMNVAAVNDGDEGCDYKKRFGKTPRARILEALRWIKGKSK